MPLPQLWVGEPLAQFRRNGEQGGGALPAIASRSGEAGGLPPNPAAPEVTPPQADETRNARTDTRNVFSTSPIAASQPYRLRAGTFPPLTLGLLSLPGGGASGRSRWQPELRILPASAILPGQADQLKLA